jgi:hypothetical protein
MSSPHLKAILFDVRLFHITPLSCVLSHHLSKIGGVVVQSPLLAIREYEIEHRIPNNYINCLM